MLLPMAGRVARKGRSRAVPRAAVTHLWSGMFLSLSWPDASWHCSPLHPPTSNTTMDVFIPVLSASGYLEKLRSSLPTQGLYRHRYEQIKKQTSAACVISAWWGFFGASKPPKPHLPGSDIVQMSAELLDTLSNSDEAQVLYEYFQVRLSYFWPP